MQRVMQLRRTVGQTDKGICMKTTIGLRIEVYISCPTHGLVRPSSVTRVTMSDPEFQILELRHRGQLVETAQKIN